MRRLFLVQGVLACILLAYGCDGGSGSNNNPVDRINTPEPPPSGTQTGYLVDAGVSGVRYETPTHTGVTGEDGAFLYELGEEVTFLIGDILLGQVGGKMEVTPFDLAGSEALTGSPTIANALNQDNAPYHAVVNIAVLLQSLDQDADPDNGIEITPEVASLFQGVSLDVNQHWGTFESDAALQQVLAQANEEDLFGETRRTVLPASALQHLYDSTGIDAETLAVTLSERDLEAAAGYEYDSEGYLIRAALPHWYMEGDEAEQYLTHTYRYDERGRMTRFEQEEYSEFLGDFPTASNVLIQSLSVETENRDYTASGKLARIERFLGGLFSLDSRDPSGDPAEFSSEKVESWNYQYDAMDRLWQVDVSFLREGESCVTEYRYDEQDRLVLVEMEGDNIDSVASELGIPDIEYLYLASTRSGNYSVAYGYGEDGNLRQEVRTGTSPGYGSSVETLHYDPSGKVTFHEARSALFDTSTFPEVLLNHSYEYDSRGNLVSHSVDSNGDGEPNRLESWAYDDYGNVIREEIDSDADGVADHVSQWEYDADGYLVREDARFLDVISYQYGPAGWGHLFTPPPRDISTLPLL